MAIRTPTTISIGRLQTLVDNEPLTFERTGNRYRMTGGGLGREWTGATLAACMGQWLASMSKAKRSTSGTATRKGTLRTTAKATVTAGTRK